MPRSRRITPAGYIYHVVNRGNDKRTIYHEPADYEAFRGLLIEGRKRFPVDLFGHCLMPNHFHFVIEPRTDDALSAFMQWVSCRYACDFRAKTRTVGHGHVFQRRFWSVALEDEWHYLTVLRYVEANAVRAHMVTRAQEWTWGSLRERLLRIRELISPSPFELPDGWTGLVNIAQQRGVLARIREELQSSRSRKKRKASEQRPEWTESDWAASECTAPD